MDSEKPMIDDDALKAMGLSFEEVAAADKKLVAKTKSGGRDRRICVCGHAMTKHTVYSGVVDCKPSALRCPCKKPRPVLEVDDTRVFLRKTEGSGAMHALARGMYSSIHAGKSVKWIIELACDRCGEKAENVIPVPVTQSGYGADEATGFDALLCPTCRVAV